MTKQTVNVGTSANDRSGDSLRTAFQKINTNFTEIYDALGLNESPLNLGAFEFTGSTLSTSDSSDITIDQNVNISSNLTVGGDIIPSTDGGVDLGSPDKKFRSLYVSNETVYFNDIALSVRNDGTLLINNQVAATPGGALTWDSVTGKPTFAPVATSGDYADLSNKPTIFNGDYNNLSNLPSLSAVALSGDYGDLSNPPTIPADIGDLTDTGNLLFDGNYASLSNKPTIPTLGNFSFSANNITASSGAAPILLKIFGGDAGDPPALISREWSFNTNGSITFPDGTIQTTAFTGTVEADTLDSVTDRNAATTNNITVGAVITTDINNKLSAATGNIVTNVRHWESAGASLYIWFDAASKPDVKAIGDFGDITGWTVSVSDGNSATVTATNPAGYFSISTSVALTGSGTLTFTSPDYVAPQPLPIDINVGANTWQFGNNGSVTFPDSTVQTTAWTGVVQLPTTFDGDVTGSVFADDSTLLVDGVNAIVPNSELAKSVTQVIDSNATVNTSENVTDDYIFVSPFDFVSDVDPDLGFVIPGLSQRNETEIEVNLFVASGEFLQSYLLGLALGRTVIATYSTASGNQILTSTISQVFSNTSGQVDPSTGWYRTAGRILGTVPEGYTGLVEINFPEYSVESHTWQFGSNGDLTAPGDITTGTNDGRFIQDCGDGTTSIRWINVDEGGDTTQLIRAYTGDPKLDTEVERAQIKLVWQNADQSGLAIRSFDRDTGNEYDWEFRGDGHLSFPDNSELIFNRGGEAGRIIPMVSDGGGLQIQAEIDFEIKVNDGEGGSNIWSFAGSDITFPDGSLALTNSVLTNGLDADLKGSVFADDSTILVDGVSGKIVGYVENDRFNVDGSNYQVRIGVGAGATSQSNDAIAIGEGAGNYQQGTRSVAIGRGSGNADQGISAVGIGFCAGGAEQGDYAIAIGFKAGRGPMAGDPDPAQPNNSIIINASGDKLNGTDSGLYIDPVREDTGNTAKSVYYNTTTKELTYANPTGGSGDSLLSDNNDITVEIDNAGTPGNTLTWTFGTDGNLTLPRGDIVSSDDISLIINSVDSTSYRWKFNQLGFVEIPNVNNQLGGTIGDTFANGGITIAASEAAGSYVELTNGDQTAGIYVQGDSTTTGANDVQVAIYTNNSGGMEFTGDGNAQLLGDLNLNNGVIKSVKGIDERTTGSFSAGVLTINNNQRNGDVRNFNTSGGFPFPPLFTANFTVNLTGFTLQQDHFTTVRVEIEQHSSAGYYPSVLQIDGVAQTINWEGGVNPAPIGGTRDLAVFYIRNTSATIIPAYSVIGHYIGGNQTRFDGDVTGSVFADDSTLLVDGVSGVLRANVNVPNTWTVTTGDKTWSFIYGDIGEGTTPTLEFPGNLQAAGSQTALFARTGDLSSNWGMSIDAGNSPYYVDIGELSGSNYWRFSGDGSLTLPGDIHGAPVISGGAFPSQVGRTVNITPADDASDKSFKFRIDQYGETFTRAYLEFPTAEVDKQVAAVFPHANGKAGFIYTQGNDTNGQGMNDAFNIFYNNGDIKITSMGSSGGLYTWKFGDSGDLTLPGNIQSEGSINIDINLSDSTLRRWRFGEDGILTLPAGGDIVDSTGTSVLGGGGSGGSVLEETFEDKTSATGVIEHDATTNRLFRHTSISANFTANFTNLGLAAGEATSLSLVLVQGATGRMCTAVQIGGAAQTILWQGSSSAPSGNNSRTDVVTFSILCTATDTYTVLGMLTSFGGA